VAFLIAALQLSNEVVIVFGRECHSSILIGASGTINAWQRFRILEGSMPFLYPSYVLTAALAMYMANRYAWGLADKKPVIIMLEEEPPPEAETELVAEVA
jgi:hypothetical protein